MCFVLTATRDAESLLLQAGQTDWHPPSHRFIPETAAVSQTTTNGPIRARSQSGELGWQCAEVYAGWRAWITFLDGPGGSTATKQHNPVLLDLRQSAEIHMGVNIYCMFLQMVAISNHTLTL